MKHYDIIIIGSGMVGASVACALAAQHYRIAIIDQQPAVENSSSNSADGRKIALSFGSVCILKELGIWSALSASATPIQQVHISKQKQLGATRIKADDLNIPELGYVVLAENLNQALQNSLAATPNITWYRPATLHNITLEPKATVTIQQDHAEQALTADLVIAADGAHSTARQLVGITTTITDYQQTAFVSHLQLKQPHHNIAYQRFTQRGTLAMLPMQHNTVGVVYTTTNALIEIFRTLDDTALLDIIQEDFGYRLGRLQHLGTRFYYPLQQVIATKSTLPRFLLFGNAAYSMSPVAAQGFNLALQDAYCLQPLTQQYDLTDPCLLENYVAQRQPAQTATLARVDHLMKWLKPSGPLNPLVGLGLIGLDLISPAKRDYAEPFAGLSPAIKKLRRDRHAAS